MVGFESDTKLFDFYEYNLLRLRITIENTSIVIDAWIGTEISRGSKTPISKEEKGENLSSLEFQNFETRRILESFHKICLKRCMTLIYKSRTCYKRIISFHKNYPKHE